MERIHLIENVCFVEKTLLQYNCKTCMWQYQYTSSKSSPENLPRWNFSNLRFYSSDGWARRYFWSTSLTKLMNLYQELFRSWTTWFLISIRYVIFAKFQRNPDFLSWKYVRRFRIKRWEKGIDYWLFCTIFFESFLAIKVNFIKFSPNHFSIIAHKCMI